MNLFKANMIESFFVNFSISLVLNQRFLIKFYLNKFVQRLDYLHVCIFIQQAILQIMITADLNKLLEACHGKKVDT